MRRLPVLLLLAISAGILPVSAALAQGMPMRTEAALGYMAQSQWDFASHEWRRLLIENPANAQAHVGLSESLWQAGFTREAIHHLESARHKSDDVRVELQLAQLYRKARSNEKSAAVYARILDRDSFQPDAFKGMLALKGQLPASNRQAVDELLKKRADEALKKARSYFEAGEYEASLPYYEIAAAYTKQLGIYNDYALAQLLSGKRSAALRQFESLSRKHTMWQLHANAALAELSRGNTVAARDHVERALSLTQNKAVMAKLYNILGYIYETAHKPSDARFAYDRAVALDPALDKARLNLAYVLQQDYQLEAAADVYRALLNRQPDNPDVWTRLGFVYELMHEAKDARKAYEKAIEADESYQEAYVNLALLYRKMDETERGDEIMRRLMSRRFNRMEAGESQQSATPEQHPLFEFVDVFTAEVEA